MKFANLCNLNLQMSSSHWRKFQKLEEWNISYFRNLEIIDNKRRFFAILGVHSNERYLTVKGLQIIKICNIAEPVKFVILTKDMPVLEK